MRNERRLPKRIAYAQIEGGERELSGGTKDKDNGLRPKGGCTILVKRKKNRSWPSRVVRGKGRRKSCKKEALRSKRGKDR